MKTISVVAAIIQDDAGRVFCTQRGYGEWKDWWEFPGGKIEEGETAEEALCREIREELETEVTDTLEIVIIVILRKYMRKILILMSVLTVLLFASCDGDKTVKTNVPIPTEFAGFVLKGCYTKQECEKAFEKYIETMAIIDENNYGTGKIYNLVPFSFLTRENFQFAGYNWTYLRLFVNDKDRLTGMQFTFTADEFEPITDQYRSLKDVLADKYGRARETKVKDKSRYCRWTDGTTLLILSVDESTAVNGETKSFCTLSYYNGVLQNALENSGRSEL